MNKISVFFKKYNFVDLFIIFLSIAILYPIFEGKQSTYIVDFGREAYVPWQILNGEVLYRDIFNVYGPLGYQINAIAYKIFGTNLSTLYGLGFLNSFLISSFVYLISKIFLNRKVSLCIAGVVITYCIYTIGVHNLMMPYSFNAVYALTGALISIYSMLLYIRERKFHCLICSFLAAGFAFANKVEYLPYFGFLFLILPFAVENKKDWKLYLASICAFFMFPIFSAGTLMLQGVSIADFFNASVLMKKLLEVPAVKYFYYVSGMYFNPTLCLISLNYLWKFVLKILPFLVVFYFFNFINFKFFKNKFLKICCNIVILAAVLIAFIFCKLEYETSFYIFSWIGIFVLTILTGFLIYYVSDFFKTKKLEISNNEKMFLFLLTSSVLVSLKGFFLISQQAYGTLIFPVLILPIYVFFVKYLPTFVKKIDHEIWNKTVTNVSCVGIILFLFLSLNRVFSIPFETVKEDRGTIYAAGLRLQEALVNYIKENSPENSTLVVLPEGAIINFLSERKSNNYYYYLIPVNVQLFGEKKILEDFQKNAPDYFLVSNMPYKCYNVGNFTQYAPEISKYITENYSKELVINDTYTFVLYKKNK